MKTFVTLLTLAIAAPALAQDSVSFSTEGKDPGVAGTLELGIFGGVLLPSAKHELYEADGSVPGFGHQAFKSVAPDLGLRLGYVPFEVLALEGEAALMPTKTRSSDDSALLYAVRAHLLLMVPSDVIVPFLALGGGLIAESSDAGVLGSDSDGELHVGIGAKAYVTRGLVLRLDIRDNFSRAYLDQRISMHWEALLGLSLVLGRSEPEKPMDSDGDGIPDKADKCIHEPGPAPDGCPPPPPADNDGDGILDKDDACPDAAGPANADPQLNGCPPKPDSDGDGVPDESDACPTQAGDGPDGCPLDTDGDGILDKDDSCAKEPETKNGHEDQDGCPDELPEAVKKFVGVIEGITFNVNKATIRKPSFAKLDAAVKVLAEYPDLRIEISGHTDSTGSAARNDELSKERAEAVREYLIGKDINPDRITAVGFGSAQPIADNGSRKGREQNRRIEFKVVIE